MTLRELTIDEFNKFAMNYVPKSVYQTTNYGQAMSGENFYSYYLGMINNGTIVAATFVMVKQIDKFKYGYAPRGFLVDYNNVEYVKEFTDEIKKYLGKKDVVAVKLNPMIVKTIYNKEYELVANNPNYDNIFNNLKKLGYYHLGYNNYFESFKPRFEAIIEMNNNYVDLFKNMSKPFKTKVRSAEDGGVRIYKGNYDSVETLYNQAKGKYPRQLTYFQNLYKALEKDHLVDIYYAKLDVNVFLKKNQEEYLHQEIVNSEVNDIVMKNRGKSHQKLINQKMEADKTLNLYHERLNRAIKIMAEHPDGVILAVVLVAKVGDTIDVVIDSFDSTYKTFNAKHLIIWKLMEKYSKDGYKYFNLGGMVHKVDKRDKFFGLNSYKLGFGAKVYEYMGDLELVTNRFLYAMFKNAKPFFK